MSKTNNHISAEQEKKGKRRISLLIVILVVILIATVFVFRYTHQTEAGREKYSVYVKDNVCNVTVTETLPSKLRIDIDSGAHEQTNYTKWIVKNVTFYVAQEIESIPNISLEEKESSIMYHIRLENSSFSCAIITFFELHYSEDRTWRDYLFTIEIKEPFTSFFMEFETFKEDE